MGLRSLHDRALRRVSRRDAPVHVLRGDDAAAHHAHAHAPRRGRARDRHRVRREHTRLDRRRRARRAGTAAAGRPQGAARGGRGGGHGARRRFSSASRAASVQRRQQLAYLAALGDDVLPRRIASSFNHFDQVRALERRVSLRQSSRSQVAQHHFLSRRAHGHGDRGAIARRTASRGSRRTASPMHRWTARGCLHRDTRGRAC